LDDFSPIFTLHFIKESSNPLTAFVIDVTVFNLNLDDPQKPI
jgi:hypothetical protein